MVFIHLRLFIPSAISTSTSISHSSSPPLSYFICTSVCNQFPSPSLTFSFSLSLSFSPGNPRKLEESNSEGTGAGDRVGDLRGAASGERHTLHCYAVFTLIHWAVLDFSSLTAFRHLLSLLLSTMRYLTSDGLLRCLLKIYLVCFTSCYFTLINCTVLSLASVSLN